MTYVDKLESTVQVLFHGEDAVPMPIPKSHPLICMKDVRQPWTGLSSKAHRNLACMGGVLCVLRVFPTTNIQTRYPGTAQG